MKDQKHVYAVWYEDWEESDLLSLHSSYEGAVKMFQHYITETRCYPIPVRSKTNNTNIMVEFVSWEDWFDHGWIKRSTPRISIQKLNLKN